MEDVLPLAKRHETALYRFSNTGPWQVHGHQIYIVTQSEQHVLVGELCEFNL